MSAKKISTLLSLLIVAAITAAAGLPLQDQGATPAPAQKAKEEFYTVTDYAAPEPEDPGKRAVRRARSNRHNMRLHNGADPKRFVISEDTESFFGGPPSHAPVETAIPAAASDAIVIGQVVDARAHLSGDKTNIYSEFEVRLDEVLKNSAPAPSAPGTSISVERTGGAVRLPSGKVIRSGVQGKPFPQLGRQYLLFLSYNEEGQDFSIVTGYELRAGRVFPLDGQPIQGIVLEPYAAYQKYVGAEQEGFLKEVREAIKHAPASARGERR